MFILAEGNYLTGLRDANPEAICFTQNEVKPQQLKKEVFFNLLLFKFVYIYKKKAYIYNFLNKKALQVK